MEYLERVAQMLVGRTVTGVQYLDLGREEDPDTIEAEGVVLVLDDGSRVGILVDYEDVDFIIRQV